MTNYSDAFKDGLNAAEVADRARRDIDEVFSDLDSQIRKASDGKLSIARFEFNVVKSSWEVALNFAYPPKPRETYLAIAATNPTIKQSPTKQLAKWQMDPLGYPCELNWSQHEYVCVDRAALESCLADLLKDPTVGERLYALMKLEPQKDETETAQPEDEQASLEAAPDEPPEEQSS